VSNCTGVVYGVVSYSDVVADSRCHGRY